MSRAEIEVLRHRLSVDEYNRMAEVGILGPDARVELIEGEIIDMAPLSSLGGTLHADILSEVQARLVAGLGPAGRVRTQMPIRLGDYSEPEPDLAVVWPQGRQYARRHPGAEDVVLLVEVSDSTSRYDREVKVPLYARHGIAEVWLVDLPSRQLHVFRAPRDGAYADVSAIDLTGSTKPLVLGALPEHSIELAGLIPEG